MSTTFAEYFFTVFNNKAVAELHVSCGQYLVSLIEKLTLFVKYERFKGNIALGVVVFASY